MAKMKIYELAKELDKSSKDIINLLADKGIEVKSHMSTIEDDSVEMLRKKYSAPKTAPKSEVSANEASKSSDAESNQGEAPKKKKNIIFVSNPHNSKMSGGQPRQNQGRGGQKNYQNTNSQNGNNQRRNQQDKEPNPFRPMIPKPVVKPVVIERSKRPEEQAQVKKPTAQAPRTQQDSSQTRERTNTPRTYNNSGARNNRPGTEGGRTYGQQQDGNRPSQGGRSYDNRPSQGGAGRTYDNRPSQGGAGRTYDNRPSQGGAGRSYDNRPSQGGTGRSYDNRPSQGAGRTYDNRSSQGGAGRSNDRSGAPRSNNQGYNSANRSAGGNRPYNNTGRVNQGNQGDKPGFRKPQNAKPFKDTPITEQQNKRDEEKRRIGQERDKRSKNLVYDVDKLDIKRNKAGRFIKPEKKFEEKAEEQIKVITVPDVLTIKELAEKMKIQPSVIVKKLFLQGQVVTVNQEIPFETAEEIAIEYEIICEKEIKVDVIEELLKEEEEVETDLTSRPPVICVMGHVDHGKTSLLDAIRKTSVTDREAGGITQHIGAYTVAINNQQIAFLDTPGHEAFTSMRMRGANATDIAILVVAADDGVMPQTVEAINHARAAGVEIIVAVNKMDKPSANMDRVKQELVEHELISEDWGGTTVFAPVSAKTGEGINQLLEMILLTADILELKANAKRRARGLVIEAELDKGRGPVATILVQKGTLKVGDFVSAGASHGKIRALIDDKGRRVKEAGPSTPVEVLGLSDVPDAGEVLIAHENDKTAKNFAETFVSQNKQKKLDETKSKMSLDDLFNQIQTGNLKELNLIVKADVQGSVEAVKQSLTKLSNEEVLVKCIHGGVGAINESDVMLASASKAIIIAFNVRVDVQAKATAEREGIDVRMYKVIYQAIEDVEAAMKGMLDPIFEERVIGHAEVRQIFKASAVGNISGSYVLDGHFERGCKVRISREGEQIYEGKLASLKRFKDDAKEVKEGFECGLVFEGFDEIQELDIVEAYIMVEVPR